MKLLKKAPIESGFSALTLLLLFMENILFTTALHGFVALPPSILIGPEPKDVYFRNIGSTKFNCFVLGRPFPTITWYKNDQVLNVNHGGISISDRGQTVTLSSENDDTANYMEGNYQCFVENQYGKLISNTTRYIKALSKRTGDDSVQILNITIGERLRLDYKGNILNRPKGSIGWKATDKDIVLDQRVQMDERGSLYFAYTLLEDARNGNMYKSETHNIPLDSFIGSSYYLVNILGTKEDIKDVKPELAFSSPNHVVALEGQNLTLKCFFYGHPQPEIEFTKTGKPLPMGRDHFIKPSTLVITNASVDDAGTYRCTGRNKFGVDSQSIEVTIEAAPRVTSYENVPSNRNVTEGEDVIFKCIVHGYPPPSYQWIIDGQPLLPQQIPPRKVSLSKDGKVLTMRNVCKRCEDGLHDMKVVQCNVTNKHGYLLLSGYLNVLEKTRAQITGYNTEETVFDEEDRTLTYQCTATGDPSTNITKQWLRMISTPSYSILFGSYYEKEEYEILSKEPPYVEIDSFGMLKLTRRKRDSKRWSQIGHKFKCFVTNGYSNDEKLVVLNIPDSPLASRLGILSWWWLFVLFALFLMLIITFVVCCRKILKQKGSEYDVDAKEKLNGNEPEKELVNHGFKAYRRPEDMGYLKGSKASLGSSGHCSDEEGSLSDYGLVDGGKFNEDGSFVGAYVTNPKPGQTKVRREYIGSPLTRYYT